MRYIFIGFLLVAATLFVQAQANSSEFPVFKDTGQPEADAADYHQRKVAWIAQYPDLYKQLNARCKKQVISQAEFDLLPKFKQEGILAQPESYIVQPNSVSPRPNQPQTLPQQTIVSVPLPYILSRTEYEQQPAEKKAYIDAHPEQYLIQ